MTENFTNSALEGVISTYVKIKSTGTPDNNKIKNYRKYISDAMGPKVAAKIDADISNKVLNKSTTLKQQKAYMNKPDSALDGSPIDSMNNLHGFDNLQGDDMYTKSWVNLKATDDARARTIAGLDKSITELAAETNPTDTTEKTLVKKTTERDLLKGESQGVVPVIRTLEKINDIDPDTPNNQIRIQSVDDETRAIKSVINTSGSLPNIKTTVTDIPKTENPLGDALSITILDDSDLFDVRKVQLVLPNFKANKDPAFMFIVSKGNSEYTAKEVNVTATNTPTIHKPFGTGYNLRYNQFILLNIDESHMEKFQIMDTFNEGQVIAMFGRKPEVWTLRGELINDVLHSWHSKFRELWSKQIRGTILASRNQYLVVAIPSASLLIECYPVGLNMGLDAASEAKTSFSMGVFIKALRTTPHIESRLSGLTDAQKTIAAVATAVDQSDALKNTFKLLT